MEAAVVAQYNQKHDPVFFGAEQAFFKRREQTPTYDWARKNFRIVAGPLKGKFWSPSVIPYAKGIMDWFDAPYVRKVFICAPSQTGKSTIAYACLGAALCRRPGPAGIGMPDESAVERIFREKLIPHFKSSPALRRQLLDSYLATQKQEIRLKDGSHVYGLWAGSESRMSSVSLQYLLIDEEDAYEKAASIMSMEERTIAYEWTSKIMRFSKPRGIEEESRIWQDMQAESQVILDFFAQCPACETMQKMEFENIRVRNEERNPKKILGERLALYECVHCGLKWNDQVRNTAVENGEWRPRGKYNRPSVVGFHVPSWISPFVSMSKVMADFFRAQASGPSALQKFDNSHRAVPGQTIVNEQSEDQLFNLVIPDLGAQVVPDEALALTFSADTQKDHFYYSVWAHSMEPRKDWVIDAGIVGEFFELEDLIFESKFRRDGSDEHLSIWRAAVDTGGGEGFRWEMTRTQQVYQWLLRQRPGVVFGTKGMTRKEPGVQVKFNYRQKFPDGRVMRHGLKLYFLDTDAFKDELFWRLGDESAEPIYFHGEISRDYFKQLLAEKKVVQKGKEVWKKVRNHNHWLDCAVGHLALVHWQWSPSLQAMAQRMAAETDTPKKKRKKSVNPYTNGKNPFTGR
jgi:phage terminase large subunit GpA-like protein